jgi:L-iditol 2-dehydrogenase
MPTLTPAPTLASPSLEMTVAACAEAGTVRIESRPRPAPGAGEMLLRLRCAGLCGTDLFKLSHRTAAAGAVLGHEVVGTVAALGEGVRGFALGDRVAVPHHVACGECALCRRGSEPLCPAFRENLLVPGGFSEWVLVRERAVRAAAFGLPPQLSDEAAVFLEPAACVLRGVRQARLDEAGTAAGSAARSAAIMGGGSMGLLHLLVLKAVHPDLRILLSDPLEERRALALRLGADAAEAPGAAALEAVAALSGGLGADAVFDTVGGAALLESALALSRPGGAVVLFAHAEAEFGDHAGFDLNAFFKGERRLLGTYSSSLADQREAFRLLVSRRLDPSPLVTHRLPLSRLQDAIDLARERRALKVLLVPDGEAG